MTEKVPVIPVSEMIPLHCRETKFVKYRDTILLCCPHQAPAFYCTGMMYPEPLEPLR